MDSRWVAAISGSTKPTTSAADSELGTQLRSDLSAYDGSRFRRVRIDTTALRGPVSDSDWLCGRSKPLGVVIDLPQHGGEKTAKSPTNRRVGARKDPELLSCYSALDGVQNSFRIHGSWARL